MKTLAILAVLTSAGFYLTSPQPRPTKATPTPAAATTPAPTAKQEGSWMWGKNGAAPQPYRSPLEPKVKQPAAPKAAASREVQLDLRQEPVTGSYILVPENVGTMESFGGGSRRK